MAAVLRARIIFVADAYDAMTSGDKRGYVRRAMSPADAVAELVRCAGTQFDPAIVEAFVEEIDVREPAGDAAVLA